MNISDTINRLREDPAALVSIAPREFEELVAELLASFGWKVSLTSQTRDGGVDILGITRDGIGLETSWAVECKRYSPDHKVGVEVVRGLYAVTMMLGFSQGVIVTTSTFMVAAKEFATRTKLQLCRRSKAPMLGRPIFFSWQDAALGGATLSLMLC